MLLFYKISITTAMFNCYATESTNVWGAGIKTGVGQNFANLERITKENKSMRNITTRMQHHLIVNQALGKMEVEW